jgi:energy-coupling factor transport system ATP-binding protein
MAGLPEEVWEKSPFDLSGGEKRRAALAGVLAMEPQTLILDEPAAGLDPKGREELFSILRNLHSRGMTIVIVSHSMEDAAREAQEILVMNAGRIRLHGTPLEVFSHRRMLEEMGLGGPETVRLMQELRKAGLPLRDAVTLKAAADEILRCQPGAVLFG